MTDQNYIPPAVVRALDEAHWLALRHDGIVGHERVREALAWVRADLVAILGPAGAAQMLRSLATRIETDYAPD